MSYYKLNLLVRYSFSSTRASKFLNACLFLLETHGLFQKRKLLHTRCLLRHWKERIIHNWSLLYGHKAKEKRERESVRAGGQTAESQSTTCWTSAVSPHGLTSSSGLVVRGGQLVTERPASCPRTELIPVRVIATQRNSCSHWSSTPTFLTADWKMEVRSVGGAFQGAC